MAKIEELTAILIDEIESFEKAIATLQKENHKIKTTKLTIDTSFIDEKYTDVISSIENGYKDQNRQMAFLQNKLNKTIIFPKWIIIVFSSFFIVFLISLFSNFYQYSNSKTNEETAYNKGKEDFSSYMTLFFEDHPESLKKYQEWNKK